MRECFSASCTNGIRDATTVAQARQNKTKPDQTFICWMWDVFSHMIAAAKNGGWLVGGGGGPPQAL